MKLDELIVGKWYSNEGWTINSFGKFSSYDEKRFYFSEKIFNGYAKIDDYWSHYGNTYEEVPLGILIKYLPEDHPDLLPIYNDDDYEYIIKLLKKLGIK